MKRVLLLDDMEFRRDLFKQAFPDVDLTWVKTVEEAKAMLDASVPVWDEVWLDHDLTDDHYRGRYNNDTGLDLVEWIASNGLADRSLMWVVHTANDKRGDMMKTRLMQASERYNVRRVWITLAGIVEPRSVFPLPIPNIFP